MKFGETFTEYLHNERERYSLEKCSHVEDKSLKKMLKTCQICKTLHDSATAEQEELEAAAHQNQQSCHCQSCTCKYFLFGKSMCALWNLVKEVPCNE